MTEALGELDRALQGGWKVDPPQHARVTNDPYDALIILRCVSWCSHERALQAASYQEQKASLDPHPLGQ